MDQAFRGDDLAVEDVTDVVEDVLERPTSARPAGVSPAMAMAREAAARAAAQAEEEPATKSRAWGRDAMMLVRRSHLYAGLLLYPWVLLYGVTAFLFNHPMAFSDQTFVQFGKDAMRGTALESVPTASEVASKVVAALNAKSDGGAKYSLLKPEAARFERGGVAANVKTGDGKTYTVTLDADGGMARVVNPAQLQNAEGAAGRGGQGGSRGGEGQARGRGEGRGEARGEGRGEGGDGMARGRGEGRGERRGEGGEGVARGRGEGGPRTEGRGEGAGRRGPGAEGPQAPFATTGLMIEGLPLDAIREALPGVLGKVGLTSPEVSEVRLAPLSFQMEAEGKPWLVTYNAQTGAVSGREVGDPASQAELTTRRFLLRLHMIHGYPSEFNERWVWAFIVDAMAFLMVFWAISGIVMWWQIKRTRRIGAAALTLSTAAAAWIGIGMHYHFVNGGR